MSRRIWIFAAAGVAAIALVLVLYDVLVETDEERLEQFVADVTGSINATRVDHARARWVDLSRQPVEVSALGESLSYGEGDDAALDRDSQARLASFFGTSARAISSGIAVEGDRATVSLRLMGDRLGMANVEWTLEKHDDDWLVARVSVRR